MATHCSFLEFSGESVNVQFIKFLKTAAQYF